MDRTELVIGFGGNFKRHPAGTKHRLGHQMEQATAYGRMSAPLPFRVLREVSACDVSVEMEANIGRSLLVAHMADAKFYCKFLDVYSGKLATLSLPVKGGVLQIALPCRVRTLRYSPLHWPIEACVNKKCLDGVLVGNGAAILILPHISDGRTSSEAWFVDLYGAEIVSCPGARGEFAIDVNASLGHVTDRRRLSLFAIPNTLAGFLLENGLAGISIKTIKEVCVEPGLPVPVGGDGIVNGALTGMRGYLCDEKFPVADGSSAPQYALGKSLTQCRVAPVDVLALQRATAASKAQYQRVGVLLQYAYAHASRFRHLVPQPLPRPNPHADSPSRSGPSCTITIAPVGVIANVSANRDEVANSPLDPSCEA